MKQHLFAMLICICTNAISQATQFSYGNEKRRYIIYLPESYIKKQEKTFPVVFNFHGGGMTMAEQMFYSRMNDAADRYQFIVVYPQGIKQDWNVGFDMSYTKGTDDVGFIDALLEKLLNEYRINKRQVYATGLSRGGFFCHRLAAELPHKFAAIASVGGPLPDSVVFYHAKKQPVAVMVIHGTSDEVVKYHGKEGGYLSAEGTYDYWKKVNGVASFKETTKIINASRADSTSIIIKETKGINAVSLISIINAGHTWPGSHPFNIGFPLGKTTKEIDVNELMWKFFSKIKH